MPANKSTSSRPRVIFAIYPAALSGVDTQHIALAQGLAKLGHDVSLLLYGSHPLDYQSISDSIEIIPIPLPPKWRRIFRPRGKDWSRCCQRFVIENSKVAITERAPAVLIAGHLSDLWISRRDGIYQIGVMHANDAANRQRLIEHHHEWNACVAVDEDSLKMIQKIAPEFSPHSKLILNGVSIPAKVPEKPEGPLQILLAGRIEQSQKRVLDLPEILATLQSESSFHVTVAGEGSQLTELKQKVQSTHLGAIVEFTGRLEHAKLMRKMEHAHIYLMLSDFEGTPMSLMEAMARGCIPVCSTGCGGALAMLEEAFPSLLFSPGDIKAAADIIDRLLSDRSSLSTLQHKAYNAIRDSDHTLDKMASSYDSLIRSLLTQP